MCSRYFLTGSDSEKVIRKYDNGGYGTDKFFGGDILPTDMAPVIYQMAGDIDVRLMSFGYPLNGKLIINARAETVFEKSLFKNVAASRRAVIPASGFYEWNQDKEKFTFRAKDDGLLFFAGLFDIFKDKTSFVIITTEANDSMQPVHDRMPLIIEEERVEEYLKEPTRTKEILDLIPKELDRTAEYEQMKLKLSL